MHFQLQVLTFLTLMTEVLARPHSVQSTKSQGDLTFSLSAWKAQHLNKIEPSKTIKERSGIVASVIASPSPNDDYGYYASIQVGSQNFEIGIDTGSDALWLLSNQLPATATGAGHTLYTPGPSASQVGTFNIVYDDNSGASGPAYADKVILGGATITSQAVGAASSVAPVVDGMNSGVLGLGFASTSSKFSPSTLGSFMGNLKSQLASPLFTVDLHNDASGNLNFGFLDSTKYRGSITYVPRLAQYTSAWLVTPGTYTIGNTVSSGTLAPIALIDTGTSLIIVPNSVVGEYYAKVPGAFNSSSGYMYPCTNLKNNLMPSFGINLGGTVFTVPGSYMFSLQHNATYCYGVLAGTTGTQAFLGDMFLRTQFVVYNYTGTGSVGFAPKATLQPAPTPV